MVLVSVVQICVVILIFCSISVGSKIQVRQGEAHVKAFNSRDFLGGTQDLVFVYTIRTFHHFNLRNSSAILINTITAKQ